MIFSGKTVHQNGIFPETEQKASRLYTVPLLNTTAGTFSFTDYRYFFIFPVFSDFLHQQQNRIKHVSTALQFDTQSLLTGKMRIIRLDRLDHTDNLSYQDKNKKDT